MILVDTCVLLDLSTLDPKWFEWSLRQIGHFGSVETLVYNPVIFAEIGVGQMDRNKLDERFLGWVFDPFDRDIAWRAAEAHRRYRARGGRRARIKTARYRASDTRRRSGSRRGKYTAEVIARAQH